MSNTTKVFVKDYTVQARIGIYDHEKNTKQPLRVNCVCTLKPSGAWNSGKIEDTFSYEKIVEQIETLADQDHIELVEVFAEKLAAFCLSFPTITTAQVTVEKTGYYKQGTVGAEIVREKNPLPQAH